MSYCWVIPREALHDVEKLPGKDDSGQSHRFKSCRPRGRSGSAGAYGMTQTGITISLAAIAIKMNVALSLLRGVDRMTRSRRATDRPRCLAGDH